MYFDFPLMSSTITQLPLLAVGPSFDSPEAVLKLSAVFRLCRPSLSSGDIRVPGNPAKSVLDCGKAVSSLAAVVR